MAKKHTAFYRIKHGGNIKRQIIDDNMTVKEIEEEMRANGFIVIKVYAGVVDYGKFDRWYLINRTK